MTLKLLVDTCVWLDLATDYREQPVIGALEDLIKSGDIELVVPEIVLDEFDRNKQRVIEAAQRSLQSHFRLVREAVNRFADDANKAETLKALNEVDHKIGMKAEAVNDSIDRIRKLLKSTRALSTTAHIKQRVTERALAKKAPYHRERNSVGDAILIEFYAGLATASRARKPRYAFVTHNTKDFSEPNGDRRRPHPDLASLFKSPRSTYWVSIVDLIKELAPDLLADHDSEFNFSQQPKSLSEILEAEYLLFRQVWYNRHWNLRTEIEQGKHKVVPEKDYSRNPYRPDQTLDTVWAQALAAAKRTEDEVGSENLGPWDDFEWGMLNGKLSALRWVLGDEWDMLDT
jgi:predicted nucleic acid-binding protein